MSERSSKISPARLGIQLTIYFVVVIGLTVIAIASNPEAIRYLPVGGTDAMNVQTVAEMKEWITDQVSGNAPAPETQSVLSGEAQSARVLHIVKFMIAHLGGTILLMLPITWTFRSIKYESGFNKNFVRSLIILPICATTTVLLVQDSLALAFGLAALVAAVRFRVALEEAMDGIFIFAAITVGLSAGIGYLGVAMMMCIFFCYSALLLWAFDYGSNPLDEARREKRRIKMAAKLPPAE